MTASAVLLTAVLAATAPVPQEADEKFTTDVAAAREKAVKFLKGQQSPQGNWEGVALNFLADMEGGSTALVTLALLEAGVPADDPAVKKAVEYLAKLPPKKTYVVSLTTQVLAKADPKKHADQIQKNADWLTDTAIGFKKDGRLEGWSYPGNSVSDNSNTHFAVSGLHAATAAGAKVDPKLWPAVREYYVRTRRDRGWPYHNGNFGDGQASSSMTAAALLGLTLAAKHDKQNADAGKEAFEKGMTNLLAGGLSSTKSEGCMLMTTAELGRAIGSPTLKAGKKEVAWYREGAEKLVKGQQPDGSLALGKGVDANPVLMTAFGLYFLGPPEKK
jgi:hypothetical protein